MKSLTRGHVKVIVSTEGIQSYRGQRYEGIMTGKCIAKSRHLHLYEMVVLSETRVVRVL